MSIIPPGETNKNIPYYVAGLDNHHDIACLDNHHATPSAHVNIDLRRLKSQAISTDEYEHLVAIQRLSIAATSASSSSSSTATIAGTKSSNTSAFGIGNAGPAFSSFTGLERKMQELSEADRISKDGLTPQRYKPTTVEEVVAVAVAGVLCVPQPVHVPLPLPLQRCFQLKMCHSARPHLTFKSPKRQ